MPTTSNFGWTTPADTDLVKDGAAAIRTLGNGIDTSLVDLKGGTTGQVLSKASNTDLDFSWVAQDDSNAIQNALLTTTGDTIYASAASTPARLGIGTTGQVLTVAGGVPSWATPSSGSMTLLSTTTWSAVNKITISSISQAYKHLFIELEGISPTSADSLLFRPNDTTNLQSTGVMEGAVTTATTNISNENVSATSVNNYWAIMIFNYAMTGHKAGQLNGIFYNGAGNARKVTYTLMITDTSVTSVAFAWNQNATNWDAGTIRIYGVN